MPTAAYEIDLGDDVYPIRLRKLARARSITVTADTHKGEVRLTMPKYASAKQALRFAQSKADWLAARFAEALPNIPIIDGTEIAIEGEPCRIFWSPENRRQPVRQGGEVQVGGPEECIEQRAIRWLKAEARSVFAKDLDFYCARAGLAVPKLSVGDARRRWGSCSGSGSIRLNWRLIMAPPMVRRSVVAHEVAHLKHMNHSREFYALLDGLFEDDRKAADRWLKEHGAGLHRIGARSAG